MSRKRTMLALYAAGLLSHGAISMAQSPEPAPPPDTLLFAPVPAAPIAAFGAVSIMGAEATVPGVVVSDKPYTASSITETTQVLADGNRIVQRNEAKVFRDSAGRTRREQTLGGTGSLPAGGEPLTLITINDPVADKGYSLDPSTRTAREFRPFRLAAPPGDGAVAGERVIGWSAAVPPPPPGPSGAPGPNVVVFRSERLVADTIASGPAPALQTGVAVAASAMPLTMDEPRLEALGEQVLEGLLVQGTRLTHTIPAGALGNERPIDVVTERWYSADIEAIVWQRHFDPRFGETQYRLVNVVRGEPSPDLFVVPQGYEVVAAPGPRFEMRRLEVPEAVPPGPR